MMALKRRFAVLYGAEGRTDFVIDHRRATAEEAAMSYDSNKRIQYMDGVLGGAEVVELDEGGAPIGTVQRLAKDERP
jgi:hypothetical protein